MRERRRKVYQKPLGFQETSRPERCRAPSRQWGKVRWSLDAPQSARFRACRARRLRLLHVLPAVPRRNPSRRQCFDCVAFDADLPRPLRRSSRCKSGKRPPQPGRYRDGVTTGPPDGRKISFQRCWSLLFVLWSGGRQAAREVPGNRPERSVQPRRPVAGPRFTQLIGRRRPISRGFFRLETRAGGPFVP